MVRRGSTVRVRQRASRKAPAHGLCGDNAGVVSLRCLAQEAAQVSSLPTSIEVGEGTTLAGERRRRLALDAEVPGDSLEEMAPTGSAGICGERSRAS
jgi:hypothetical protein